MFCLQELNITGLNESQLYTFEVTTNNQVGESNVDATTMIMTNESSKCVMYLSHQIIRNAVLYALCVNTKTELMGICNTRALNKLVGKFKTPAPCSIVFLQILPLQYRT